MPLSVKNRTHAASPGSGGLLLPEEVSGVFGGEICYLRKAVRLPICSYVIFGSPHLTPPHEFRRRTRESDLPYPYKLFCHTIRSGRPVVSKWTVYFFRTLGLDTLSALLGVSRAFRELSYDDSWNI